MPDNKTLFRAVTGPGGDALEWRGRGQTLRVEPWGPGGVRVRCAAGPIVEGLPGALLEDRRSPPTPS